MEGKCHKVKLKKLKLKDYKLTQTSKKIIPYRETSRYGIVYFDQ